jgi:hypothetical protein
MHLVFAAPLLSSKITKKWSSLNQENVSRLLSESGECVTRLLLSESGECVTSTHEQLFQCLQLPNNATITKIKVLFPQAWVMLDDVDGPV